MEKAGFISRLEHLDLIEDDCDRLYFGNELCERLIPDLSALTDAARWAEERGIPLTLVTPFVTDQGIAAVEKLIKQAESIDCLDEVVFNDWGIFTLLRGWDKRFSLLLGRLLTKQKRGPRILNMMKKVPPEMLVHFRRFSADSNISGQFLKGEGVKRIELDNTLQGIERTNTLPASLYLPYAYISTTRYCLTAYSDSDSTYFRDIGPCQRQCREYSFELKHGNMPVTLLLKGNTYFFENRSIPDNLEELVVNRIVNMPVIPM